jgi:DNA-binding NarL/FixJ family response regulator
MQEAITCGAAGFLPKSSTSAVITEAITQVLSGQLWLPENAPVRSLDTPLSDKDLKSVLASLTPQQYRVAMMLYSGLQNKQIAAEMQVTEATIKAHLTSIFRKFGVKTRTQAVLLLRALEIKAPA